MTDENFDVIIIGAGHNGLAAAAVLAKAGRKLIRHCKTADLVAGLEHEHAFARFRQHSRAYQAVVAGTDDDGVVAVSHRRNSRGSYPAGAGRTGFPARRSHRGLP